MKKTLLFALCFAGAIATQVKAQLTSLNETFESFDVNDGFPQNGWSTDAGSYPQPMVYLKENADGTNKYVRFYSAASPNTPVYLFVPQVVASDGTYKVKFRALSNGQGNITVTVCLLRGAYDMNDVQEVQTFSVPTAETDYEVTIPKTDRQYIAFKFESTAAHGACSFDSVIYSSPNMATAEVLAINELVSVATTSDQSSLFFATKESAVSEVKILSVNGQVVLTAKPTDNRVNISSLNKGVYIVSTTLANGKTANTKFIKK